MYKIQYLIVNKHKARNVLNVIKDLFNNQAIQAVFYAILIVKIVCLTINYQQAISLILENLV